MHRYRIVSQQGAETHVSSVVIGADEIGDQLAAEAFLHCLGGWTVTPGDNTLVCRKGEKTRVITVRASDPMHDQIGKESEDGRESSTHLGGQAEGAEAGTRLDP